MPDGVSSIQPVATDARIMIAISSVRVTLCFDMRRCRRIARILEVIRALCDSVREHGVPLGAILLSQSNRESLHRDDATIEPDLSHGQSQQPAS